MSAGTIIQNIFGTLFVIFMYTVFGFLIISNGLIRWTLECDVACNCGKKMLRKVYREKKPTLVQRFFFLPFRKKTKKWHYIIFLINIAIAPFVLFAFIVYVWIGPQPWIVTFGRIVIGIQTGTTVIGGIIPYYWYKDKVSRPLPKKKKQKDWEW